MFAIAWEFLTGVYRATDFTDRSIPEWPIHPDRVFQALVAAWAERGSADDEKSALLWLESQGNPDLSVPDVQIPEEPVRVYVPTNDIEPSAGARKRGVFTDSLIGLLPEKRKRKPRYFPHVWVGEQQCALVWRDVLLPSDHRVTLQRVCGEVTRIGHSSSFVRCWIDEQPRPTDWVSTVHKATKGISLRVATPGRLARLVHAYEASQENRRYDGTPKATEVHYRESQCSHDYGDSDFSPRIIVFQKNGGPPLDITKTKLVTETLRKTLIPSAQRVSEQVRQLVSGHQLDGAPLHAPHIAYIPLPYVGTKYADGHLLGVAMVLPRFTTASEEDEIFRAIALSLNNDEQLELLLGSAGVATFAIANSVVLQKTLQVESWVGSSSAWATVTPIVMDNMQNSRRRDPDEWVKQQIGRMCVRVGLPAPSLVQTGQVSPLTGTPAIRGWPPLRRKDESTRRMVHAVCHFHEPVFGPILLGSGRYRGYGMMKPIGT